MDIDSSLHFRQKTINTKKVVNLLDKSRIISGECNHKMLNWTHATVWGRQIKDQTVAVQGIQEQQRVYHIASDNAPLDNEDNEYSVEAEEEVENTDDDLSPCLFFKQQLPATVHRKGYCRETKLNL